MNRRPKVAFLDVNETLSDLRSVVGAFEAQGLSAEHVRTWYLSVLRDGFASTVLGDNPGYAAIGQEIAKFLIREVDPARDDDAVDDGAAAIMTAMVAAQPHSDVVPGLVALANTGVRVMTLSNGSADVAKKLLGSTPADAAVEKYLSVIDAGAWKPAPASYRHGLMESGVAAADALMVAVHPWDLEGARRVGLRTAWINRSGARWPSLFAPPDVEAESFTALALEIGQTAD
ncbi:HAD family hydrolase [Williamsia maris]|uniref:2-haloacid dehalogenase n=1 Tax=Williamsia maris TaxID=72806 RepID=A0ABT1H917_9NOCA|nr:HAD family hydrolase [Williamsia maris]MCP2174749.1 2-haloacid dehalogenase [Williamsia maris]